jgi:hypothetical protein
MSSMSLENEPGKMNAELQTSDEHSGQNCTSPLPTTTTFQSRISGYSINVVTLPE